MLARKDLYSSMCGSLFSKTYLIIGHKAISQLQFHEKLPFPLYLSQLTPWFIICWSRAESQINLYWRGVLARNLAYTADGIKTSIALILAYTPGPPVKLIWEFQKSLAHKTRHKSVTSQARFGHQVRRGSSLHYPETFLYLNKGEMRLRLLAYC